MQSLAQFWDMIVQFRILGFYRIQTKRKGKT